MAGRHERAARQADGFRRVLENWTTAEPGQQRMRAEYLRFLGEQRAGAVERDLGRAHVTGSAFVLSPDLRQVLLCFHRKAGLWLQLGGHVEPADESIQATARREAQEESGIAELRSIGGAPVDLDRHELGPGFTRCDTHWDVGYAFLAAGTPIVSDESEAVRWWPIDALPEGSPPGLVRRVRRAVLAARHTSDDRGTDRASPEGDPGSR